MAKMKWGLTGSGSVVRTGYINGDVNSRGKYTGGESKKPVISKRTGKYGHLFYCNNIKRRESKTQKPAGIRINNNDDDINEKKTENNIRLSELSTKTRKPSFKKQFADEAKQPLDIPAFLDSLEEYHDDVKNTGCILYIPFDIVSMSLWTRDLTSNRACQSVITLDTSGLTSHMNSFLNNSSFQHIIIQYNHQKYYAVLNEPVKKTVSKDNIVCTVKIKELMKYSYQIHSHATKCRAKPYGVVVIYKNPS